MYVRIYACICVHTYIRTYIRTYSYIRATYTRWRLQSQVSGNLFLVFFSDFGAAAGASDSSAVAPSRIIGPSAIANIISGSSGIQETNEPIY